MNSAKFSDLRNLYWIKRQCRKHDAACRRRLYRYIAAEKKRLLGEGVPYLELHLICRVLTTNDNQNAMRRLQAYYSRNPPSV